MTQSETETWKPMPGFDSFILASSDGQVGILCLTARGSEIKVRKPLLTPKGYHVITLPLQPVKKRRHYFVHRLVMLAFVGDSGGLEVNHKNGIKTDNRLSNLEYCTRQENVDHARIVLGSYERLNPTKLTEIEVRLIRTRYAAGGVSISKLAWQFGIAEDTVRNLIRRKTWKHVE